MQTSPCQCPDCTCTDAAERHGYCGCCMADCPEKHGAPWERWQTYLAGLRRHPDGSINWTPETPDELTERIAQESEEPLWVDFSDEERGLSPRDD